MHRRGAPMGVEALRSRPARVFGDRVNGPALRIAGAWTLRRPLILRHWTRLAGHRWRWRGLVFRPTAQADGGEALHETHAALLRMIVLELAALGPDFILRRQWELIDARHARRPLRAFGQWRNECRRHRRLRHWR